MKRMLLILVILLMTAGTVFAGGRQSASASGAAQKLAVEVFDRGTDGGRSQANNNEWTRWIQQKVLRDLNIEVEFYAVGRWSESTDIVNLMSSGSAPDLCYTYNGNMVSFFREQGGIMNLAPYIDTFLPDMKKLLGEDPALPGQDLIYRNREPDTGRIYSLPNYKTYFAEHNVFIRKVWLDALRLPLPKTTQEFYNALVAFRDRDPGNVGRNNVIPFGQDANAGFGFMSVAHAFLDPNITNRDFWIQGFQRPYIMVPGFKDGIRLLNQWYNEGLILRDFPLLRVSDDFNNILKSGVIGAYFGSWDNPWRGDYKVAEELAKNVPGAEFVAVDCIQSPVDGVTRKNASDKAGGISIFIPAFSRNHEAALKYLNWLCLYENFNFLQLGTQGVNHEIVNGVPRILSLPARHPWIMNSQNNIDYTLHLNGVELLNPDLNGRYVAMGYEGFSSDIIVNAYNTSMTNGRPPVVYQAVTTLGGVYGQTLSDKANALISQAVIARPADFDRIWDAGIRDYLASGAQEIMDERAALWPASRR